MNPAEVLISIREPFNKNTLWINPHDGIIEIKIFNKRWISIFTTEDKGLSNTSLNQITELLEQIKTNINNKLNKHLGKYSSDSRKLLDKQKNLEEHITKLESKLEKLTKRYQTISLKSK